MALDPDTRQVIQGDKCPYCGGEMRPGLYNGKKILECTNKVVCDFSILESQVVEHAS